MKTNRVDTAIKSKTGGSKYLYTLYNEELKYSFVKIRHRCVGDNKIPANPEI